MTQETFPEPSSPPIEQDETDVSVCYRHPGVETGLRCNRCEKPICVQCAKRTPVGFRCPDCIASLEDRYYSRAQGEFINPYDRPLYRPIISPIVLVSIVVIWLLMEAAGGSTTTEVLNMFGANIGVLIMQGEVWRFFTSMFLHIGVQHLVFNSIGIIAFGFETERLYGSDRYVVIYILSGLFGSLVSFAIKGPAQFSAGASGAIFGVLGVQLAFFLLYRQQFGEFSKQRLRTVLILVGVSFLYGLVAPIDHAAHLGGLVAGFILGYAFAPRYQVNSATAKTRFTDRGSLWRRWWVFLLSLGLLVGGTAGAIQFWWTWLF